MEDISFSLTIEGDSEGYITFECPFCGDEFKLQASEYQDENFSFEDLFCPYCGLTKEKNDFLSHEIIEQAKILVENYLMEQLNKSFKKMSNSINKDGRGLVKMKYKPLKKAESKELKDKDTIETEFICNCCEHHLKVLYSAGTSKIFCPYCGVDI